MQENEWAKYILVAKLYFNYKFYIYTFQSKCLNINLKLFEKYYKYHIFIIQSVILHKPTYSVKMWLIGPIDCVTIVTLILKLLSVLTCIERER